MFFSKRKIKKEGNSNFEEDQPLDPVDPVVDPVDVDPVEAEEDNALDETGHQLSKEVEDETLESIKGSIHTISSFESPAEGATEEAATFEDTEKQETRMESISREVDALANAIDQEAPEDSIETKKVVEEFEELEEPEAVQAAVNDAEEFEEVIADTLESLVRELIKEKIKELNAVMEGAVRQMIQARVENLDKTIELTVRRTLGELLKKHLPLVIQKVATEELKNLAKKK